MSNKKLKGIGFLLFIPAALLAALYTVYVKSFSGETLHNFQIIGGAGVTVGPLRFIHKGASETTVEVGPVDLSPEMNPLRLILDLTYGRSLTGVEQAVYDAELLFEGQTVWLEKGSVRKGSSKKRGESMLIKPVKTFNIEKSGNFNLRFHVQQKTGSVYNAKLILRKNAMTLNLKLLLIVGIVGLCGLICIITSGVRKEH